MSEMIRKACARLGCCLNGLFKKAFAWKLRREFPGVAAQHAYSLYQNGGRLHHFVCDFLRQQFGYRVAHAA